MERITRSSGGHAGGRRRRLGPLVLVVAALGLAACDPPPPPDGRDLAIEAIDAPTDLAPGEAVTFSVVVANHGDLAADGVRVGHLAPSHLRVDELTGPGVTGCTQPGDLGSCALGTLDPGETRTLELTVTGTVAAPAGDLVLAVLSSGSEPSPDPHPNIDRVPIAVGTGATVDLQVQGELPDDLAPGTPFTSSSWITNRSSAAASEVVVTQEVSDGGTILGARLQRALPGGGVASGSCDIVERTARCTTDGALVEPTTVAAQRWVLEVEVRPDASQVDIDHTVSSPHPEPDPDPGPNTATTRATPGWGIFFDPVPPVVPGQVFDVTGRAVTDFAIPVNYVSVSLPPNIEAVSVTIGGRTTPCVPSGGCAGYDLWGIGNGSIVTMRLRAVAPGPSAGVSLSVSTIGVGLAGRASVQVVDPAIASEVHPELASAADGVVDLSQTLDGTVHNTGSSDHADVTATFDLSPSVQITDARWGEAGLPCTISGSTASCALGAVPAYASEPITLQVTPTAAGPVTVTMRTTTTTAQDEPDPVADVDTTTFDVAEAVVDLGLTPYVTHDPAVEGVLWQVVPTIRNHGNFPASGIRLVATVPDGVEIGSTYLGSPAPSDSGGCSTDQQVITCEVGTVPAGGRVTVLLLMQVTVDDAGPLRITVTSDHTEPSPDPHPNELSHDLTVVAPRADLQAGFDWPPREVVAGQPFTITHRVGNPDGPSLVEDAVGTLEVPPGWTITAAEWDRHGVPVPCAIAGSTSTCEIGQLTTHYAATLRATIVPGAVQDDATLVATASSSLPDDDLSDNTATHTIDVVAATTDLGVTASHGATAPAGGPSVVELRVTNAGPAAAAETSITADLPASVHVEGVDTSTTGFSCEAVDQVLSCTHPMLPVGEHLLDLTLRDTTLGPVSFTITAATTTTQAPDVLPDAVTITRTVAPSPARVTGTVVDADGEAVAGVGVAVYRVGETTGLASGTTSAAGTYDIGGLDPGQYQVRFLPSAASGLQDEWHDDRYARADATVFTAAGLGERFVANAELAPRAPTVIRGRVVDEAGQPVAGVNVGAYLATDGVVATFRTTTAADGTYALTVPENQFRLRFGPPAALGLVPEWFDDQALRADAAVLVATARGQVIVADAELATAGP